MRYNSTTRVAGVGPTHAVLKTAVLPLNYTLKKTLSYRTSTAMVIYSKKYYLMIECVRLLEFRSPLLSTFSVDFSILATEMFPFANLKYSI